VVQVKTKKHDAVILSSESEKTANALLAHRLKETPLPEDEIIHNLGLYLTSKTLSRILFFYEIYKLILPIHGSIIEFGVRWGQTLSLMIALRSIFEPFNRHRQIIGFDTFEGFRGVTEKDGQKSRCAEGSFSVAPNYQQYLDSILATQENLNPMAHLRRYELRKGDAVKTVPQYFQEHPESVVALAIFDFDIYTPTKAAMMAVLPHLCKGSVMVFDELSDPYFPGETLALQEVLGLNKISVRRFPMTARVSYAVVE
jgi:hypothetical protein